MSTRIWVRSKRWAKWHMLKYSRPPYGAVACHTPAPPLGWTDRGMEPPHEDRCMHCVAIDNGQRVAK